MLVLSRRMRDSIMIGHDIVVTILSIGRDQVRIGIRAPADVEVHREEVYRAIQQANREAATS
ncbi:MAG TPA: carbon storage regulator CsrA, partial [Acidimicrobiales bacterium]|nr:carbon storage regulator CsrA [Acidimicrobiales bacterium]